VASFGSFQLQRHCLPLIQQHRSRFSQNVIPAAAPSPLFRDLHQSALDRVCSACNGSSLRSWPGFPHHEVVEPMLPNMLELQLCLPDVALSLTTWAFSSCATAPRKTLFENLHHHCRNICTYWWAEPTRQSVSGDASSQTAFCAALLRMMKTPRCQGQGNHLGDKAATRACLAAIGSTTSWCEPGQVEEKIRYMHYNPVQRGLVQVPEQWRWSSGRITFWRSGTGCC